MVKEYKRQFAERFIEACENAGIKPTKVASVMQQQLAMYGVKVSIPAIWKWRRGVNMPARNAMLAISKVLNVSTEWLEHGVVEEPASEQKPVKTTGVAPDIWSEADPLNDDDVYVPYYKSIELAAGNGRLNNEDYNGYKLRFSRATLKRYGADPLNVMCFPVSGDSMSPVIPNKSTVTVDTGNKKIVDGGIYAIEHGDLFRVKLLYRMPGKKLSIRSYNKDEFPDEEEFIGKVNIIGRVINWSVMAWY